MPKRPILMFAAVFTVCLALTEYLAYQQYQILQKNRHVDLVHEAAEAKDRVRNILFNDIAAANTLAIIYKQYGVPAKFDNIAQQIIHNSRYAEALQITENGIVKNAYPDASYKNTIGSNVNADPKRKAEEERAINRKDIYFAGPRRLKFGDTGILGKVPVIVGNKVPAVITVLTRLPALKRAIEPKSKFSYQLLKVQGHDTLRFSFSNTKPGNSSWVSVKIPEGDWVLQVGYGTNFGSDNLLYELGGLGLLFSLACGLLAYREAQEPYALKKTIDEKTEQLAKSEKYFRTLIETSSDAVVLMDNTGYVLYQSPSAEKILGYSLQEIQKIEGLTLIHPDDREKDNNAFYNEISAPGAIVARSHRIKNKNGHYINIEGTYRNLLHDDSIKAIVYSYKDVTEKILSEKALIESEARFRSIFEDSTLGMGLTSISEGSPGRYLKVNRALCEILGYTEEELLLRNFMENTHPEDLTADLSARASILKGESKTFWIEKRYIHKNGGIVWANVHISVIRDNDNQPIYMLGQVEDITERVLSQQKIVRYNHELTLLNRINDVILRTNTEFLLYQEACGCLADDGLYKLAWICLKPDDSALDRVVKPIAAEGDTGYLSEITIDLNDPKTSKGPTGTTLLTQKTVVNNDANNASFFTSWIKQAQNHGINASIALPLFLGDGKTGALTIYSAEKNAFDADEVLICERIAANLSIAVQNIKSRIEKEKAQHLLHERVKEISTIHAIDTILQREVADKTILLQDIVEILPSGLQYPDICGARILFDGKEYKTKNYAPTAFKMTANFCLSDEKPGTVEVVYTQHSPTEDEGPFFKEERQLLRSIVDTIKIHLDKFIQQAALTESENRFRRAFEDSAIGMGLSSIHEESSGKWIKVNQPLCEMLGYTEDELLSITFIEITHPDDLEKSLTARSGALNGSYETYQIEKRYLHKKGNPIWANVHVSVIKDKDGHPMYLMAQIENITERLNAQNALAESENRFRRAFEDSAVGIGLTSVSEETPGRYLKVNKSLCQIFGYTEEELLSRSFLDLTHPDDLASDLAARDKILKGVTDTYRIEKRYIRKNGSVVWANLNVSVIRDKNHQAIYLVAQVEDITEKRESQVKFQSLVEESIVGVYILQNEKVVYANPRLLQETGYTEAEITGMPVGNFIYSNDYPLVIDMMNMRMHEGLSTVRYEARIKHKNGTPIWYEFFGSTTIYNGAPALIGTMINMTERKAAELEINRLTRLYQFLGSINEAMLKAKNTYQVYAEACRIAISVGGFRMAWIGAYNEKNDSITPVAWNGHENGFLNRINVTGMKVSTSNIPSARAIRQKSLFYYNDIANDLEIPEQMKAEMLKQRYLSALSFPIFIEGEIVAALVLLMSEPFFFNDGEIELLRDVTENITYALEKIRIQTLQTRSEANMRSVFDNTHVGYLMLDSDYQIVSLNQQMKHIYLKVADIQLEEGKNLIELLIPEKRENILNIYSEVIKTNRSVEYESAYIKNGETLYFLANVNPIHDGKAVTGICITTINITEQKKLTEKLLDQVNAIERQNEKLRNIAWMQSHVIRAPLARIMALIDLFKNNDNDGMEARTILDYILISADELDDVIKDITNTVYDDTSPG